MQNKLTCCKIVGSGGLTYFKRCDALGNEYLFATTHNGGKATLYDIFLFDNATGLPRSLTNVEIDAIQLPLVECGVTGVGITSPVITHDVEYISNETTGFLDKVYYTWIDGVLQPTVTVPTTYTTETKPKDVEVSTVCNTTTGVYNIIERIYKADGTLDTTNTIVTTIGCLTTTIPILYNNVKHELATNSTPVTIASNTVNSISYKVLSGIVDISIGGVSLPYSKNEQDSEEATTTINQEYIFTPQVGAEIKIKTIY